MIAPNAICTINFYKPNANFVCKKKFKNMSFPEMVKKGYSIANEMKSEIEAFKNTPFSVELEFVKKV